MRPSRSRELLFLIQPEPRRLGNRTSQFRHPILTGRVIIRGVERAENRNLFHPLCLPALRRARYQNPMLLHRAWN